MQALLLLSTLFGTVLFSAADESCRHGPTYRNIVTCLEKFDDVLNSSRLSDVPYLQDSVLAPKMEFMLDFLYFPSNYTGELCCEEFTDVVERFPVNPFEQESRTPVEARAEPFYTTDPLSLGSDTYSLMMLDGDVPNSQVGTADRPILHWFVANDRGEGGGDDIVTLMNYTGPAPPDYGNPHRYMFVWVKHGDPNMMFNETTLSMYTSPPGSRYLFDVSQFLQDYDLTIHGINWFTAQNDRYTNVTKIENGLLLPSVACPDSEVKNEELICPATDASGRLTPMNILTSSALLFVSTVLLMMRFS